MDQTLTGKTNKDGQEIGKDNVRQLPPRGTVSDPNPKDEDKTMFNNLKERFSSLKTGVKKKSPQYEESLVTKSVYLMHIALTFSGRVTRKLMEGYKKAFALPENESGDIYMNLGIEFLEKSDFKQAIAAFRKSLNLHPENEEVFFYLGNAYFREENYKEAVNIYMSAIKADPQNASAYYEMGLSYAGLEKYAEAIASYKKAIALEPENDEIYYWLGVSYDQIKDYQNALLSFKKATELNPRVPSYYHSLGFTYECIKQHDKAIECFKRAIELERK